MDIAKTERLRLRLIGEDDADFFLRVMNDPDFVAYVGDRGLRTRADALRALRDGPLAMQAERGHSLYLVERLEDGVPLGFSGLIKRETLQDVDIGYAFLPDFRGHGYALEAARAVVGQARSLGIPRLAAITAPDNAASIALLLKLGMRFERSEALAPETSPVNLYLLDLAA